MSRDGGRFSDEHLNAFVDGQLTPEEQNQLLLTMNGDRELRGRVRVLQKTREMVRHAYQEVAQHARPSGHTRRGSRPAIAHTLAAVLLLGVGISIGWVLNDEFSPPVAQTLPSEQLQPRGQLAITQSGDAQIILHLSSSDSKAMQAALDEAEHLLGLFAKEQRDLQLEIVANAGGLDLLRVDTSPYAQRIARMQRQYHNLTFLACMNAIERLEHERHVRAQLLPGIQTTPSAFEQIMLRLQEGWAYLKV